MHAKPSLLHWLCLIILLFAAPLHADWVKDGAGICISPTSQYYPQIVSDGEGGAIIALYASGTGQYHYVQRVDAHGVQLWGPNGVQLCPSSSYNYIPITMVQDGAGGAIIAWRDGHIPEGIYAQRVNGNGAILWNAAGVAVCTAAYYQQNPQMAPDGSGGAYIVWQDERNGNVDIYAQRLDASGNALWTADGEAICVATGSQEKPQIDADAFGAYIAWKDNRSGNYDIYVQRIAPGGTVSWTANGVAVCTAANTQELPDIIPTGYGGTILAWQDYRGGSSPAVYMHHINAAGTPQWTANGIAVTSLGGDKMHPQIVSDGTTAGSVVVWEQSGGGATDIYAQRFNGSGTAQWTTDGVAVCSAYNYQSYPKIARDGDRNLLITWYDQRIAYETDIYAQKLNFSGAPIWTANGVSVCSAAQMQSEQQIVSDGARGAIIVWHDARNGANIDIYAQRIEENGYWGYPAPDIFRVRDVPGDQGGSVTVSWYASRLDPLPDAVISKYTVWRAIDQAQASRAVGSGAPMLKDLSDLDLTAGGNAIRTQEIAGETYFWELMSSVDAYYLSSYSKVVPTLFDSTAVSAARHYFQVIAHTSNSKVFWISEPDSGRSVDNLAPVPPVGLAGEQQYTPAGLELTWRPNGERDLGEYAIYRGTSADFAPGPGNLVASTPDTLCLDGSWSWSGGYYYKVAAIDIHGNVSGYALLSPDGVTDADTPKAPAASFLAQNFPNPFNPTTRIAFGLAAPANVSLRIYDTAGRLVRVLVEGARPAGNYSELWDGRDARGAAVASGIYFYRLQAGAFTETRKMALLR